VSASADKKKKEAVRWAAAGWFGGPAGLAGPKGGKISFFSFLSQTPFKTTFLFQIQTKFFQTFSQKIYKLFRSQTSNQKNHASQLMMHKHLLSLYLLNYV
jgi:hypothetical protein